MYDHRPLTGCYRGLTLVSTVSCTISHYPYRDGKRKFILTVSFDRLRPVGVPLPRPVGMLVSRMLGPLVPRPVGPLVPRPVGPLVPRPVGPLVPRLVGVLVPRLVSPLVPRPVGPLVLRLVGVLVPRLLGVLVSWVDVESGGGRSECSDETMPVDSSRGLSVSSSRGGPVRWCSVLPCPYDRLLAILTFVEGCLRKVKGRCAWAAGAK